MTIVDLTQIVDATTPVWPGAEPFCCQMRHSYEAGCLVNRYALEAGCGTHLDAPLHFIPGGRNIVELSLAELIVPACVIDIRTQVEQDHDYSLALADIELWEAKHGQLPVGCVVLASTGWARRWHTAKEYCNADAAGVMRFPSFSAKAVELLLQRDIVGIGIDTLSPDTGKDEQFPVHELILQADKYIIENLASLEQLPPKGARVAVLPIKIKGAAEAPARVVAFLPD